MTRNPRKTLNRLLDEIYGRDGKDEEERICRITVKILQQVKTKERGSFHGAWHRHRISEKVRFEWVDCVDE